MMHSAKLHFFCGKMAAGKSTLARTIARQTNALLLVEDDLLERLYPGEISSLADYIRCSARAKHALEGFIGELLLQGNKLVLDFPGNTKNQRIWFKRLIECSKVSHALHVLEVSDEICKQQLRARSIGLPEGTAFTTEQEFDALSSYFQAPCASEHFNLIRHVR